MLFNEPKLLKSGEDDRERLIARVVSVLFNEPKLLKSEILYDYARYRSCFSALQRAEIAEIEEHQRAVVVFGLFQCSSTSRNC